MATTPACQPPSPPDELVAALAAHGQGHVLHFWDQLDPPARAELVRELESIDLDLLARLAAERDAAPPWPELAQRAQPPPAIRLSGEGAPCPPSVAVQAGRAALERGTVAVLLVAGGQGTRLGRLEPKGMLPIGPVSGATLYQLLIEQVAALRQRYRRAVPLWLMTSPATEGPTRDFLERHGRFGLPADELHVFCQGTMPAVDAASGKLLLADKGRLSLSPDGHGGMLAALARSRGLEQMAAQGIEHLFYIQVDNPLVEVCEPGFLGYHLICGSQMSTQVVPKRDPQDRLGNVASIDGRVQIIEYSDLPPAAAAARDADGRLRLWAGNTAVHVLEVAFLRSVAERSDALPLHRAHKRVAYVDESGRRVEPSKPNAVKFERFIFDLLPLAQRAIAVEVDRQRSFAPVKNDDSAAVDTPRQAQAQMCLRCREWLEAAGARVAPGIDLEISPLFALDADELRAKIPSGTRIERSTYFR